jgi:hypothetical protein
MALGQALEAFSAGLRARRSRPRRLNGTSAETSMP